LIGILVLFIGLASACCIDNDGDGYGIGDGCLGTDCDDNDSSRFFIQGFYLDEDHDGFGTGEIIQEECWGIGGYFIYPVDERSFNNLDCHDLNKLINPSQEEICGNFIDENCDGIIKMCYRSKYRMTSHFFLELFLIFQKII